MLDATASTESTAHDVATSEPAPPPRRRAAAAPGPSGLLSAWSLIRDPISFLTDNFRRYGDVARYRIGPFKIFHVLHPDGVKHVLQENHRNYLKSIDYQLLKRLLGNGLLTSEGDFWLGQRRLMAPMFHRQRVAGFGDIMVENSLQMLEGWAALARSAEAFDVTGEMMRLTLKIVGRALVSLDLSERASAIGESMTIANERFGEFDIGTMLPFLPTRKNLQFRKAVRTLRQIVLDIISERRREGGEHGDLLSMLLAARDEDTGAAMSDAQLRDEVLTLILAGHETTANALSWTWFLLGRNPEAEAKLHAELREVLGGRPPTIADLRSLNYTGMVIDEVMRLYPPAWAIGRRPIESDEIMGYRIPKGSNVMLSQYVTHRHPGFWDEPEKFDPERFTPQRAESRPRYAYFPFGGGPRQCIGNMFALTEAQLVLATVAQHYRLKVVPDYPVELQPLVTLRPRYGVKVVLEALPR